MRAAGIGSVMHAYDDLDGLPCAASRELLTTILRERWGFDGIVVADYLGIEHLLTLHEMVADLSDAAAMTLTAGLDMELPATNAYGGPLAGGSRRAAWTSGSWTRPWSASCARSCGSGLFERPYVDVDAPD